MPNNFYLSNLVIYSIQYIKTVISSINVAKAREKRFEIKLIFFMMNLINVS